MGNPKDFKVILKERIKDPEGLNLPTLPISAMVVGNAIGHNGNRTGVYGHSERSIGVYGESPVYAGFFEGDVFIDGQLSVESGDVNIQGNLVLTGNIRGKDIDNLSARIAQLEALKITERGGIVSQTITRPSLEVTELFRTLVTVEGTGFRQGHILFAMFNITKNKLLTLGGEIDDIQDLGTSLSPDGKLHIRGQFQGVDNGDKLAFSVTDGRPDPNDTTGFLWSNQVVEVVGNA